MLCLKKAARCRQSFQRSLQLRSVIRGINGFMGFSPILSVNFVRGYCPACLLKSAPV